MMDPRDTLTALRDKLSWAAHSRRAGTPDQWRDLAVEVIDELDVLIAQLSAASAIRKAEESA